MRQVLQSATAHTLINTVFKNGGNYFFAIRTSWFFLLGINFCDFQKVPANKSLIIFSFLLSTSNEIINTYLFVYHMAGSQLEVVSAAEKILVFTSRITARGIRKSMAMR